MSRTAEIMNIILLYSGRRINVPCMYVYHSIITVKLEYMFQLCMSWNLFIPFYFNAIVCLEDFKRFSSCFIVQMFHVCFIAVKRRCKLYVIVWRTIIHNCSLQWIIGKSGIYAYKKALRRYRNEIFHDYLLFANSYDLPISNSKKSMINFD